MADSYPSIYLEQRNLNERENQIGSFVCSSVSNVPLPPHTLQHYGGEEAGS